MALTLGSLFSGSGGFELGGMMAGLQPVWNSEIEPFPVLVTHRRFPWVTHYGDVAKVDGAKIQPVDVITFGSPCQDMSIAGKRDGLDGGRSCLFFEAIRIIREMRDATDGKYPAFAVWENVPGAFSSNGGEDFGAVLDALCSVKGGDVSVPRPKRWGPAGEIVGDGYSVAWRVLDAQYWGVPQRRKRIYAVADFAGGRAGQVLFESEGVSGYSAAGFRAWEEIARDPERSPGGAGADAAVAAFLMRGKPGCAALPAEKEAGALFENHGQDSRYNGPLDKAPTVNSQYGTGGNNQPLVVDTPKTLKIRCGKPGGGKGALIQDDRSATLSCNNDQTLFEPAADGRGSFDKEERTAYSMTTGWRVQAEEEKSPSILARDFKAPNVVTYGIGGDAFNQGANAKYAPAIEGNLRPGMVSKGPGAVSAGYLIRRLTPTECARLQGFPDWWCAGLEDKDPSDEELKFWYRVFEGWRQLTGAGRKPKTYTEIRRWLAAPHSDAAEYKLWGNGVALPCVWFVMCGIAWAASP